MSITEGIYEGISFVKALTMGRVSVDMSGFLVASVNYMLRETKMH